MILASPVFSSQGVMLLREETHIIPKHILLFKTWGVLEADIVGIEVEDVMDVNTAESNNEELICLQEALEHRFSNVLENEIMTEIFRIAKKQLNEGFLAS
jgi:hypothetical protein